MISAMAVPSFMPILPGKWPMLGSACPAVGTGIRRLVKRARLHAAEALLCILARSAGAVSVAPSQRSAQPPDQDAAGAVVGRRLDLIADVEHQFRHVVMPVEMRHRFGREPAAVRDVEQRGRRCRKLVDIVQHRLKQFRRRNDAYGEALGKACDRGLLAVNEEYASLDRAACG